MGTSRKFLLHKRGELVEVKFTGCDRFKRQGVFQPLPGDRIVGVDTESLQRRGKLSTVLVPLYFSTGQQVIEVPEGGNSALDLMLEAVCGRYSVPDDRPSRTVQRDRVSRDGRITRDGRREAVDPVLLVFFNLPYDLGRLCEHVPQLLRALASGADTYRVQVGDREIEVCRTVLGHGSSLEWYVREERGGEPRITRLLGIDCHGYWKSSLREAAKAAGVTEKVELEGDWFVRPIEDFSEEEWSELKRYAGGDAQSTAELYTATVDLLRTVDARVVRRTGVVPPSAPGAAARIAFAKAFDEHPNIQSWRRLPAWVDQLGCSAYRGARAFSARPGRWRDVRVHDIKSAYPFAMTLLPDPVTVRCERVPDTGWNETSVSAVLGRLRGKFGVLAIDGVGMDPVYPALRCHDAVNKRLQGVYGPFRSLSVTVPEVMMGLVDGSLRIDRIRDGVVLEGSPEKSFLRRAMLDFFAIKDDPGNDKALQNMGKLLANSTYGKLIEVMCGQHWIDSDVMCPEFEDQATAAEALSRLYAEVPAEKFDDAASYLIERWSSHRIECRDHFCVGCGAEPRTGAPSSPLRLGMSRFRRYEAGQYFMPAYAAQVTGFTSAALGLMARCTSALQGDTDSVHVFQGREDRIEDFFSRAAEAGYPWPRAGLGSWSLETHVASEESLCARIKLYSHRFRDPVTRCGRCSAAVGVTCSCVGSESRHYKQAKHGFGKYPGGCEALHEAVRDIVEGRSHTYETKPSPRKIREALVHGLPVGEFVSREVQVSASVDPNTVVEDGVCRWKPLEPKSPHYRGDS